MRTHRNALSESEAEGARVTDAKARALARKAETAVQRKAERAKNTAARALIRKQEADLRDFHAYLDLCKHTRICNVCGERRNSHDVPDANRISLNDALFDPLLDNDGQLVMCYYKEDDDESESDGCVWCCVACHRKLLKGDRPDHAYRLPDVDKELVECSLMELQSIRPVIPFVQIHYAFGAKTKDEGSQYITKGQSANIYNKVKDVLDNIPRRRSETEMVFIRTKKSIFTEADLRIRPAFIARKAREMKARHLYSASFQLNDEYIAELDELGERGATLDALDGEDGIEDHLLEEDGDEVGAPLNSDSAEEDVDDAGDSEMPALQNYSSSDDDDDEVEDEMIAGEASTDIEENNDAEEGFVAEEVDSDDEVVEEEETEETVILEKPKEKKTKESPPKDDKRKKEKTEKQKEQFEKMRKARDAKIAESK